MACVRISRVTAAFSQGDVVLDDFQQLQFEWALDVLESLFSSMIRGISGSRDRQIVSGVQRCLV
jgi:hypothetical protein